MTLESFNDWIEKFMAQPEPKPVHGVDINGNSVTCNSNKLLHLSPEQYKKFLACPELREGIVFINP